MFFYECSCGHELELPNQATVGELFCPECGEAMTESRSQPQDRPKQNYLALLALPLGLLAAFGTWYFVEAFTEKPNNPMPAQQQPAK